MLALRLRRLHLPETDGLTERSKVTNHQLRLHREQQPRGVWDPRNLLYDRAKGILSLDLVTRRPLCRNPVSTLFGTRTIRLFLE